MKYQQNTSIAPIQTTQVQEQVHPDEKAYLHTYQAAVGVPFLKALVTGGLFGLTALVLAWLMKSPEPWRWGLGFFVIATLLRWAGGDWFWILLAKAETVTGIELDGKPGIGSPSPVTRIDLTTGEGSFIQTQRMRIPATREQMLELGMGILGGRTFSEGNWTGKGKAFSLDEFRALRDYFEEQELIELSNPKSPKQGYRFNDNGRDMLKRYVPYPTDEVDTP